MEIGNIIFISHSHFLIFFNICYRFYNKAFLVQIIVPVGLFNV